MANGIGKLGLSDPLIVNLEFSSSDNYWKMALVSTPLIFAKRGE
jgi:hypothetical protein